MLQCACCSVLAVCRSSGRTFALALLLGTAEHLYHLMPSESFISWVLGQIQLTSPSESQWRGRLCTPRLRVVAHILLAIRVSLEWFRKNVSGVVHAFLIAAWLHFLRVFV